MSKELLIVYNKYKIIIFPVLVGIASLLIIVLIIIPQVGEYFKGRETLFSTQSKANDLDKKNKALQNLNLSDLQQKLVIATQAFPINKEFPGVVSLIQKLTADQSLSLSSLQISQSSASRSDAPSFTVKFEIAGNQFAVNSLLNQIEKSSRVIKVTTLDVSSTANKNVSASIAVDAFYGPTPTALGALDEPLSPITTDENNILSNLSAAASSNISVVPAQDFSGQPRGKVNPFE